jgi:hypothetical protein
MTAAQRLLIEGSASDHGYRESRVRTVGLGSRVTFLSRCRTDRWFGAWPTSTLFMARIRVDGPQHLLQPCLADHGPHAHWWQRHRRRRCHPHAGELEQYHGRERATGALYGRRQQCRRQRRGGLELRGRFHRLPDANGRSSARWASAEPSPPARTIEPSGSDTGLRPSSFGNQSCRADPPRTGLSSPALRTCAPFAGVGACLYRTARSATSDASTSGLRTSM